MNTCSHYEVHTKLAMRAGEWKSLEVAIKTVIFSSKGGDAETHRVAKEAAIASNLSHQNVVATYSHDIVDVQKSSGPELGIYKFCLIQVNDFPLPLQNLWLRELIRS